MENNGRIARVQAQQQEAAVSRSPLGKLKALLGTDEVKKRLSETMKENAGAFSASIIELFNSDRYLAQCEPAQVIAECFKAASLRLPMNKQLGFAYVVPYKDNKLGRYAPQFQLGYRGYIQLAQRSGAYKYINCDVVYEGELCGRDKITGEIDLSGERKSDTIVGYFAFFELLNGFRKTLYMSYDEMVAHAKKYSKAYGRGPWQSDFDAMALKTCLRLLLSKYGIMSVDMERAVITEYSADTLPTPDADYDNVPEADSNDEESSPIDIEADEETGEVTADA